MCVVYFYQSELWRPNGYRLVLANNRDEHFERPTKEVNFWGADNACISGLDQEPGREGGTWLGMNSNGKIGVLLNILEHQSNAKSKQGRGFLVSDFISGSEDIEIYGAKIHAKRENYNGFNLLLFDLGKQEDSLTAKPLYISNSKNYFSYITMRNLPANAFFGASNSPLEYPFQKVVNGQARFGHIVSHYPTVNSKAYLIQNLLELMSDQTSLLPDPILESAASTCGYSPTYIRQRSAINVWCPAHLYGTRTTTLLLVDGMGQVDYIEHNYELGLTEAPSSTIHKTFSLLPSSE